MYSKITYKKSNSGKCYKQLAEEGGETVVLYSPDSHIQKAEKLLLEGQDEVDLIDYEEAHAKNPRHLGGVRLFS